MSCEEQERLHNRVCKICTGMYRLYHTTAVFTAPMFPTSSLIKFGACKRLLTLTLQLTLFNVRVRYSTVYFIAFSCVINYLLQQQALISDFRILSMSLG